jgi:hypothetical protein
MTGGATRVAIKPDGGVPDPPWVTLASDRLDTFGAVLCVDFSPSLRAERYGRNS